MEKEDKIKKEQKAGTEVKDDAPRVKGQRSGPIINDVTREKQTDMKIEETEQSLKAILSASPIGICRLSKERVFVWVNDAMCRITGYSLEEFAGKNSRFLFENDEDYEKGGVFFRVREWYETKHRRKDGSMIDVFLQFTPIDESSYIATVTDITGRKRREVCGRKGIIVLFLMLYLQFFKEVFFYFWWAKLHLYVRNLPPSIISISRQRNLFSSECNNTKRYVF